MPETPSVLALRPGAKLSKADRATLREIGIVVVTCAPEDLVAIQSVSVLPANEMLRHALKTIEDANLSHYAAAENRRELRAHFGRRLIESYLAAGETRGAQDGAE